MASIKQNPLPDVGVVMSAPMSVQSSAQAAVEAIGSIAGIWAGEAGRRAGAAEAAATEAAISEFEDANIALSFRTLAKNQDALAAIEEEGYKLSPEERKGYDAAVREAAKIDAMESQTGKADKATLQRAALYQQYKEKFPGLSSTLRDVFKKQTGQGVMESLISVEQAQQKAEQEEQAAMKDRLTRLATDLGFVVSTQDTPQLMEMVAPYEKELIAAQTAARQADLLKNQKTIRTEVRIAGQEAAVVSGFKGALISNQLHMNRLLKGYDPATVTGEARLAKIQELQMARRAFEVSVRDAAPDLDQAALTTRMKPILDAYDDAISVASGELTAKDLQTNNKIRTESAMLELNRLPGYPELSARLQTFRNIPAELVAGEQRVKFSTDMVQPMLMMLATGMSKPTANPYGGLEAVSTPDQLANQYRGLRDVAIAELGNSEAAQNLADALQSWTNQFTVGAGEVPLGVLHSMLEVAAEPGVIGVLDKSPELPKNLVAGFSSYTDRMRASLAEDLNREFNQSYKVFKGDQAANARVDKALGIFAQTKTGMEKFRLVDMIDVVPQRDGSLRFDVANPKANVNPDLKQAIAKLNKAYGVSFGKMARAYAHIVQHNLDYRAATEAILASPEWQKVGENE